MIETKLRELHSCWNSITGQELNYRAVERLLYELHNNDFTAEDLTAVLKHVLAYNRTHPEMPMKVQIHRLCGDMAVFGSICAEAKAKQRNKIPPPTAKETVLHQWRGVTPEGNGNAKHIAEVFSAMRKECQ